METCRNLNPRGSDNDRFFCCNSFYGKSSQRPNLDFKIDTIIKTVQNQKVKMKKVGIRTQCVRFEIKKLCVTKRNLSTMPGDESRIIRSFERLKKGT